MVWTIGKRISVGFSIVLILLGITTIMSYSKIGEIAHLSQLSTDGLQTKSFLVEKEMDHLVWLSKLSESIVNMKEITVQLDHHKCGFGKWLYKNLEAKTLPPRVLSVLKDIEPIHKNLHNTAVRIKEKFVIYDTAMDKNLDVIWMSHLSWINQMSKSIIGSTVFKGETNHLKCGFGKWYKTFKTDDPKLRTLIDRWVEPHHRLHQAGAKVAKLQRSGEHTAALSTYKNEVLKQFKIVQAEHKKTAKYLYGLSNSVTAATNIFQQESFTVAEKLREKLHHLSKTLDEVLISKVGNAVKDIAGTANFAKMFMLIFGAIAVVVGSFLAFFITRSIVKPMTQIGDSLDNISQNVGAASTELSDASQQLSSMSSEQASSVEETSSSLEEIEGMVQNNISHAQESVTLANKVKEIASDGNIVMEKLEGAMHDIADSNSKIGQLVQVIGDIGEKTKIMDEIVFQTKLLSFNASVEAERAGEHGRGFAVVAQEVGNLAQMSGKSAAEIAKIVNVSVKNAESIINENKERVEVGSALVQQMNESLKEIVDGSTTVSTGASGVLDASTDQGKGIKQINIAMVEIDKVTQETAATAEETASSSEELSAQVDSLRDIVSELTLLVIGNKSNPSTKRVLKRETASTKTIKPGKASSGSDGWDDL